MQSRFLHDPAFSSSGNIPGVIAAPDGAELSALPEDPLVHNAPARGGTEPRGRAVRPSQVGRRWPGLWRSIERRIEEERRWIDPAVALLDDAIIGCDLSGRIRGWDRSAAAMFGYAAADAAGKPVTMLAAPERGRDVEAVLRNIGRGCPASRIETTLRHRDGTELVVTLTAAPVRGQDGTLLGASMVLRDVTEARRVADDLAAARNRLTALREQMDRMSRLSAMEGITLDLTHELNQPLSAIANYLHAGQRLVADQEKADRDGTDQHGADRSTIDIARLRVALEGALAQSMHATQIVRGMRDFVTRGQTNRRIENVPELLRQALALALHCPEGQGVSVSTVLGPAADFVVVDRVQLRQVMMNLIRNAVEAMRGCERRKLTIASSRADRMVEISVADSGSGIMPEIRDRLFEPFVTTKSDGTGLGLTICRLIIEAHGGRLWYEAASDGGSVLRFTVPGTADAPA